MSSKDCWTGMFTCKNCKVDYHLSSYTTKNGVTCRFCTVQTNGKKRRR